MAFGVLFQLIGWSRYYVIFIDNFTRDIYIEKWYELRDTYRNFAIMIESQFADNAKDYRESELTNFLAFYGTLAKSSCPYTS